MTAQAHEGTDPVGLTAGHTSGLLRAALTNLFAADRVYQEQRSLPEVHLKVLMAHEVDQLDLVQLTWQPFVRESVLLHRHASAATKPLMN